MKKKDEELGLLEIAALAGVSRQTAYWAARAGEIVGARQTYGRIWIAPRGEVVKWARKRKREDALRREAAEHNPMFGVRDAVREGMSGVSASFAELKDRIT